MGTLSVYLCLWLVLVVLLHVPWSLSSSVPPPIPSSDHLCLPNQRDALLQFKNIISVNYDYSFDDQPRRRTESWNKSIDCCSWEGVVCDNLTGHVIGINLTQSFLEGPLFANNTLFHLHNLQWLDLSHNQLDGSLLEENTSSLFHNLNRLQRLNLAHNNFNGTISSEFFTQLVSLTHLNLSGNIFSGLMPNQISHLSSLVSLDLTSLYKLRFDGQDFDMLATNLTKLRNLVLDSVDMSDVAVTSFLNLPSSLETLSLRYCQLHGEFPSQAFQLPNLKHINLGWNENLTGCFPNTNWGIALEFLYLSDCSFRGTIPASFGNLIQIIYIDLSENQFEGQIPDVFGNLTKLTSLSFSHCNLSGPLPMSLFNLTQITSLDLSNNNLEGPLRNNVSELQLLEYLDLSHNSISGGVPSWLFTLPSLLHLHLSYNKLAGPIGRIQQPNSVKYVELRCNDIHGPIPDSIFNLVNLGYLDLSSNSLSGVVKTDLLSKLTSLEILDVSNNSLLSLRTGGNNDGNYSFPRLMFVKFSGCNVKQFPYFFQTSKLRALDLSNNKISGGISKWEAQGWEDLRELNLSYNLLTTLEQFPGQSLDILDLRSNLLQGPVLSTCFKHPKPKYLELFLISDNNLIGNIPSSIRNWSSLEVLDLSRNSLSGTIPECLGNSSDSLQLLNLQMNNFYGKIPDSFVNKKYLRYLLLNDNQFEGFIPPSLANSTSLQLLNLGHNKLAARFPHWLASLSSLQVLILRFNRFHGSMSPSMASYNFSALRILDLSGNEFTGPLQTELFQNMRAMTYKSEETSRSFYDIHPIGGQSQYYYPASVNVTTKRLQMKLTKTVAIFVSMDLSNNQFSGQIPEEVGQLVSLQMLNFSHNNFTGPIPASFGNLVALESLDLSSNKLGGRIPSQITNLTFLEVLNLSENDLVGPIPHGKQFDTFDNDSYSDNLGLCGFPLSKQCIDHGVAEPPAPVVLKHEASGIPFIWKVVMMGYGSGVVLGVSLGYIVFTTGRPWCFVRMVERDWQPNFTKWMRGN